METLKKIDSTRTIELDDIVPPPHYDAVEGPQIVTADTARSGPVGRPVSVVLMVSLVAVMVALALVAWFVH